MADIACGSINGHVPVQRHLNRHVRCSAKTIKSEPPARLDPRKTQRAEADNPRAEERRGLLIWKPFGDFVDEVFGRDDVLRVAAVDRVSCERRVVAKIFCS